MIRRLFIIALALCVLGFGPVAPQEDNPQRTSKFYNGRWWGNGIHIMNSKVTLNSVRRNVNPEFRSVSQYIDSGQT
jgi:hypothetical protein